VYISNNLAHTDWSGVRLNMGIDHSGSDWCGGFGDVEKWLHEVTLLLVISLAHWVSFDLHPNDYNEGINFNTHFNKFKNERTAHSNQTSQTTFQVCDHSQYVPRLISS